MYYKYTWQQLRDYGKMNLDEIGETSCVFCRVYKLKKEFIWLTKKELVDSEQHRSLYMRFCNENCINLWLLSTTEEDREYEDY